MGSGKGTPEYWVVRIKPGASCSRSTACRNKSRVRRSLLRPPNCRSRRASSSASRVRWRAHNEGCRSAGDDRRPARRRSAQAQKRAVQPALPAATNQLENTRGCARCVATSRGSRRLRRRSVAPRSPRLRDSKMPKRMLEGVVVSDKQDKTWWCASSAASPSGPEEDRPADGRNTTRTMRRTSTRW